MTREVRRFDEAAEGWLEAARADVEVPKVRLKAGMGWARWVTRQGLRSRALAITGAGAAADPVADDLGGIVRPVPEQCRGHTRHRAGEASYGQCA